MKSMTLKTRLAGAVAAFALIAAPTAASAEPMLWKVSDKDSTMHLFGTIHVLDQADSWRTPAFDAVFKGDEEVWFEIDIAKASDPAAIAPFQSLMVDPAQPISKRLKPEEYARFSEAAKGLGVDPAQIDILRPWAAALQLTMLGLAKAGASPDAGVDKVLAGEVAPRPLKALETLEQQLRFFADMAPEVENAFLLATVDDLAEGPAYFRRMADAWRAGDIATLEKTFLGDMQANYPEAYDILLKKRNEAWAEILDAELKGEGSDFVAVGALHLVGPDSVPKLLKARGYKVEQVNLAKAVK